MTLNGIKNRVRPWQCVSIPSECPHSATNDTEEEVFIAWIYVSLTDKVLNDSTTTTILPYMFMCSGQSRGELQLEMVRRTFLSLIILSIVADIISLFRKYPNMQTFCHIQLV